MNGFSGNTASGASEKPGRGQPLLNLSTSQRMLPLVRRIVADIARGRETAARLKPEQAGLERERHDLTWPERSRRYRLQEEIEAAQRVIQQAVAELKRLGLALVDIEKCSVGFPTIVNGRKAYFSWRPGEEVLRHWHFAGETARRPIPASWIKADEASLTGKS